MHAGRSSLASPETNIVIFTARAVSAGPTRNRPNQDGLWSGLDFYDNV
jgi:hypothetical protein